MPQPGWAVFHIEEREELLFANLAPQFLPPRHWTALGIFTHPSRWFLISDTGGAAIRGDTQVLLFRTASGGYPRSRLD